MKTFSNRLVGMIILAAGASQRMGSPKAALPLFGAPLLELHVRASRQLGLDPILIVLGHQADRLQQQLQLEPARIVLNPAWPEGQFSSLRAGLRAIGDLPPSLPAPFAWFLTPVDCPPVPPTVLQRLAHAARRVPPPAAVIPTAAGEPGHPVLLGARAIARVLDAPPDATLEAVLRALGEEVVRLEVESPDILWNLNRPDDAVRYLQTGPRSWLELPEKRP